MGDEQPDTIRLTEHEALTNVGAGLGFCATGALRCSEKTRRPSAATVRLVADVLVAGDFSPDDAIAAFAWPLLLQTGGLASGGKLVLTPKGPRRSNSRPTR